MSNCNQQGGLYVPQLESDACGIGLIAQLEKKSSHQLVSDALTMLENMEHRGACGCDPESGDGAGLLIHIPHDLFLKESLDFNLPDRNEYGVGCYFMPKGTHFEDIWEICCKCIDELDLSLLGIRRVPVNNNVLGEASSASEPDIYHIFVRANQSLDDEVFERKLMVLRKYTTHTVTAKFPQFKDDFYIPSLSAKTLIYKGQLTSRQVRQYFLDLQNRSTTSAVALVHSRFSTNTIPQWKLAQPFRVIAHNGEINTIEGNKNWWMAKEKDLISQYFSKEELSQLFPLFNPNNSDSSIFDNVVEFLIHNGRSLAHALMMMIPEAWQNARHMEAYKKDFYEYHEAMMEPWDGPASMCFTDGSLVGGTLDRNGLRPSRYCLTKDHRLILASETGVLDIDPSNIIKKGRLEPGKILIADLDRKKLIGDEELKKLICQRLPYEAWIRDSKIHIDDLPEFNDRESEVPSSHLRIRQTAHGFTLEDEDLILKGMVEQSKEPVGSMGADVPLAILSKYAQHISNYFRQQFAQVTNPPIDSLREKEYMTLKTLLGGCKNILEAQENSVRFIRIESPVLDRKKFLKLKYITHGAYKSDTIDCTFSSEHFEGALKNRLEEIFLLIEEKIQSGRNLFILDNTGIDESRCAIPSLLVVGGVHHFLVKKGLRQKASIIVNGGDILEVHHFATLLGYGADAIFPSVAYETVTSLFSVERPGFSKDTDAITTYRKAVDKGLLKVMSKLGISTIASYRGAQTFEALGIAQEVINLCFKGTISRISGMTFDMLAREALTKHHVAYDLDFYDQLIDMGIYQWKRRGEYHLFNPTTIHLLQHSTSSNRYDIYNKYAEAINKQEQKACTLRSLFDFKHTEPIPIEEVESVDNILRRFATGAMSFGSISYEAHTTLAKAMNRIGGKSNSGEGGEDEKRYKKLPNGDWERSAIKQVASGRFGVTINYLTEANEIQIKMAQGAKPGEGGQLPGHKVDDWIAKVRNSTPGVGLISPPPHHDIYSIEDLAQLIFDLKNANRDARISVKLVSKAGVGIIASGVTKGKADHILIAGHDGGTGASPLSSIRHAGLPWELGLSETHQTLIQNKIRDRVVLQTDGQIRTGRDLAIATLLGAEEWGIATAALVVEGCILMRKCHLNTCPVGIATQDPLLRQKFNGKVDHVVNFFHFLARDLREIMARLGFKKINDMVGRSDLLTAREDIDHWKVKSLDLSPIFFRSKLADSVGNFQKVDQDHEIDKILDKRLISYARQALEDKRPINSVFPVLSTDRAVGTMLSNEVAKKYGSKALPHDSIRFRFRGSAGQSFGAFLSKGLTFTLEGDSNDYFGKGLSGGKIIIIPDRNASFLPDKNIIIGNVALYGATSGEVYVKGMAGERFCVRNSGASAVVEGLGAHGCEYMTGGMVVVLGQIGRNFAAGMSGGTAYLYCADRQIENFINRGMVELEKPTDKDLGKIRTLVRNHFKFTSSRKALYILENWKKERYEFVKIMPVEYKKALALKAKNKELIKIQEDYG